MRKKDAFLSSLLVTTMLATTVNARGETAKAAARDAIEAAGAAGSPAAVVVPPPGDSAKNPIPSVKDCPVLQAPLDIPDEFSFQAGTAEEVRKKLDERIAANVAFAESHHAKLTVLKRNHTTQLRPTGSSGHVYEVSANNEYQVDNIVAAVRLIFLLRQEKLTEEDLNDFLRRLCENAAKPTPNDGKK